MTSSRILGDSWGRYADATAFVQAALNTAVTEKSRRMCREALTKLRRLSEDDRAEVLEWLVAATAIRGIGAVSAIELVMKLGAFFDRELRELGRGRISARQIASMFGPWYNE